MAKGCALSPDYLPQGGLPRNSVNRITDRHDMTSAVDRGRKASTQNRRDPAGRREPGMECGWMTERSLIGINGFC